MRAEDVRAAVRESADLGQWLGARAHALLPSPVEIIAFSDEEGVRRAAPHCIIEGTPLDTLSVSLSAHAPSPANPRRQPHHASCMLRPLMHAP